MSKVKGVFKCMLVSVFLLFSIHAWAQGPSGEEARILEELKMMKERIRELEAELLELKAKGEEAAPPKAPSHYHPVKGLADRVKRIEEEIRKRPVAGEWAERINVSGRIEVEANWSKTDYGAGGGDDRGSDISLATVELGLDVDIGKHVGGHLLFLYEDGEGGVDVDEGFIILDGKERVPFYLNAGKLYVPFGWYESHFISDPLTLELGETNESGVRIGYASKGFEISGVVFNGDVDERGEEDDHVDGWVLSVSYEASGGVLGDVGLMGGISYINNIGESDGLEGEIVGGEIDDYVAGIGMFLSLSFKDVFFVEAEYVGALDEFRAGELGFDGGEAYEPKAWNFEVAYKVMEWVELGMRYGGSDDGGDFLAESQWGVVGRWEFFPGTTVALEYLYSKFENHDKTHAITGQLAVEF